MSNEPSDFDFKFLPDWLKEPPSKNAYANYEGVDTEKPERDYVRNKPGRRDSKPRDQRRSGPAPRRDRQEPQPRHRPREEHAAAPRVEKPRVNIEFLPEPNCTVALAKQIKTSARAYPIFGLARMFLEKPERHRVKITSADPAETLWQCGEHGPVSFDRQAIEKTAFAVSKHLYYEEETVQGEPPKGNYKNVARCRLSGTLLGPTNHHAYQPSLRRLYDERFSRRMPFAEFQKQIEIVSAPEVIEAWKEQARSVTTFKTLQEPEPATIESASEAERHFRANYLDRCLRAGKTFELSGAASRNLPDRDVAAAVRDGWEAENRFPGQLMNHLRREFIHAGLYIFKHRNRVQLVSAIRPTPFTASQQTLSDTIAEILKVIADTPKCGRAELAAKVLQSHPGDDPTRIKSLLAPDLHWLIHAGHVIEMHNGILDLPLAAEPQPKKSGHKASQGAATSPAAEVPTPVEAEIAEQMQEKLPKPMEAQAVGKVETQTAPPLETPIVEPTEEEVVKPAKDNGMGTVAGETESGLASGPDKIEPASDHPNPATSGSETES